MDKNPTDFWNPSQYEKFKSQRSQPFWDLVNLLQPATKAEVIDIGCGTGELTLKLHEKLKAKSTLGIDSSESMLKQAKAFANKELTFSNTKIEDFVYKTKNQYDIVFSNAALQWVVDHETLITNLLTKVKPGGQVAIQMPFNHDHPSHRIAAQMAARYGIKPKSLNVLPIDRYAELLYKSGFKEQNCFLKVYAHPMPSGRDVIEWTKGTLLTAYQTQLSPQDFSQFLNEYSEDLLATIGEGEYFYAFKRLLLWARRGQNT